MTRRQLLILAASASALSLLPGYATTSAAAAEPKPDPPVTVTKTDGTSVKGKLVSYDRDKLTLAVSTKPKDPATNVDISWDQIKHVTNGPTREQAIQKWKGENRANLCAGCHGDGTIFCPTCHGTAHDPSASAGCPTCKGAAEIKCSTSKCDHGTIPCPNRNCLKLSDGGWTLKPDGLRWKTFNNSDRSSVFWSEHHVGQVVEKVNGQWQNTGNCPVCGGATTINDPVCKGTGTMPCPTCSKKTNSPPCLNKCVAGLVQCPTCKGSGLKAS